MKWLDFLLPPRTDELALRNISLDTFLARTAPKLVPLTRPGTIALLPFPDTSVRSAIHEAKYHGNKRAFEFLAAALADYLRDADDVGRRTSNIYLVPIPLGRNRRAERGFNQVERICTHAMSALDIKLDETLLERVRETVSQISLPRRTREENMRGAFRATRPADPAATYIVIDDVLTTGATLQAAIDALQKAGAEHIVPLALAH